MKAVKGQWEESALYSLKVGLAERVISPNTGFLRNTSNFGLQRT